MSFVISSTNDYPDDDDIPIDFQNDINAYLDSIDDETVNPTDEDESMYSEDVQSAFANYEQEVWLNVFDRLNSLLYF